MSGIEREKRTVRRMIAIYCRYHLRVKGMPEECRELADYACLRLDRCRYGTHKTACKRCPTHCYKPEMREKIRQVMRWVGPRMIVLDPLAAIRHIVMGMRRVC